MDRPLKELGIRASEAAALADLVLRHTEDRTVDDECRKRIAREIQSLNFDSFSTLPASLQTDPAHASAFYVAVDTRGEGSPVSLLLHVSPVSAPNGLFRDTTTVARVRPGGGRETVITAIPFGSSNHHSIRTFAQTVDRSFLPRAQRERPAIAAGNRHPEISLPAVFDSYQEILASRGLNLASTAQLSATREMTTDEAIAARDGENPTAAGHTRVSIRHLYHAGVWAAIRAGWRQGYTAEADHFIISGNTPDEISRSIEGAREAIRQAAGFTKFTTDTSRLFELEADTRHPSPWSDATVRERLELVLNPEERRWAMDEFSRPFEIEQSVYRFTPGEIERLAVKFARSLKLNEELYDFIGSAKAAAGHLAEFDFEPSLDEAETLTTPKELIFYMRWLARRGRPAQLVPPNLGFKKRQAYPVALETSPQHGIGLHDYAGGHVWPELLPRVQGEFQGRPLLELADRVAELARVAGYFNGTLSVHSGSGKQPEVLEEIGRATSGRVNYKISGELQLQLFDVLAEQPADSPWRQLFERMVARAERFAEARAFGAESELAAWYRSRGIGAYLGDASRGRVDGNLFLVFWLGNIAGSRDTESPDGDRRFFKEKLDELPPGLLAEVRRRNTRYVVWLAQHLLR